MRKLSVYYVAHIIINIVLLIVLHDHISVHFLSVVPLFLIALMAFQTTLFKAESKEGFQTDTAYSVGDTVRLTDEERDTMYAYLKQSFFILLPFETPLIFFIPSWGKLLGLIPYSMAYILGGMMFKIKRGKAIQSRIDTEKQELQKQMQKEELGLK